jgi:predicted RNase H-like HicB family nuclease
MSKLNKFQSNLQIFIIKEGKYFVAICPALDLSGYGKTKEDARSSFEENLQIFFEETVEKGTLDKILLDLGWTLRKKPVAQFSPPQIDTDFLQKFINSKYSTVVSESILIPLSL